MLLVRFINLSLGAVSADTILPYFVSMIGALLAALCTVLAWVGLNINKRLEALTREVSATNGTLRAIEKDLRGELSNLDRRVTRVEMKCEVIHDNS